MNDRIRISTEIQINAQREAVWSVLLDFTAYPVWNPYLIKVEGQALAGNSIMAHSVPREGMEPMAQEIKVVSAASFRMHWEGGMPDRSRFKGNHFFELIEKEGGTLFLHYEDFSGSDAAALLQAHGALIEANFAKFNKALKTRSEE